MVRKISHSLSLRSGRAELVRPRVNLLAFVSSLALAPACTLVVGERPERNEDAGADAAREQDAATEEDSGADAGPREDLDAGTRGDSGASADASGASDAGSFDATQVDAAPDTGTIVMDSGGSDSAIVDAGPAPDCGANTGTLWYPDGDGDGYGRSAEAVQACAKPANGTWVLNGGDCKDNHLDVRPGQTGYFDSPYRAANGNDSFDYDCSGAEDGNPGQLALPNGCDGILDILNCSGTGYMREARTGAGVNPVCGSTKVGTCTPMLLSCTTAMESNKPPYQCK